MTAVDLRHHKADYGYDGDYRAVSAPTVAAIVATVSAGLLASAARSLVRGRPVAAAKLLPSGRAIGVDIWRADQTDNSQQDTLRNAELEKLRDPSKPVAVIAIGYGPDTDQAALEQIAAATDGAAYQALQPTDIGSVLVDATTQRGCRPNCG